MTSSERLDGDKLGEQVGDDGSPGTGDFPPDQALGTNDPNLVADDDVAMREARLEHETEPDDLGVRATAPLDENVGDLLPPDGDDGHADSVHGEIASAAEHDDTDRAATPAEVAALHETE
jgi:hypothetical protein